MLRHLARSTSAAARGVFAAVRRDRMVPVRALAAAVSPPPTGASRAAGFQTTVWDTFTPLAVQHKAVNLGQGALFRHGRARSVCCSGETVFAPEGLQHTTRHSLCIYVARAFVCMRWPRRRIRDGV